MVCQTLDIKGVSSPQTANNGMTFWPSPPGEDPGMKDAALCCHACYVVVPKPEICWRGTRSGRGAPPSEPRRRFRGGVAAVAVSGVGNPCLSITWTGACQRLPVPTAGEPQDGVQTGFPSAFMIISSLTDRKQEIFECRSDRRTSSASLLLFASRFLSSAPQPKSRRESAIPSRKRGAFLLDSKVVVS